jgi:hypothetical protein
VGRFLLRHSLFFLDRNEETKADEAAVNKRRRPASRKEFK